MSPAFPQKGVSRVMCVALGVPALGCSVYSFILCLWGFVVFCLIWVGGGVSFCSVSAGCWFGFVRLGVCVGEGGEAVEGFLHVVEAVIR